MEVKDVLVWDYKWSIRAFGDGNLLVSFASFLSNLKCPLLPSKFVQFASLETETHIMKDWKAKQAEAKSKHDPSVIKWLTIEGLMSSMSYVSMKVGTPFPGKMTPKGGISQTSQSIIGRESSDFSQ